MPEERSALLRYVLDSPWSDFYRRLYKDKLSELSTRPFGEDVWGHVPFLTRADITQTPLGNRVFVDPKDVYTIRSSSGTTGSTVLLTPRTGTRPTLRDYPNISVRGYLSFLNPHHVVEEGFRQDGLRIPVVAGDLASPEVSIGMAAALSVNVMKVYVHSLERLRPALEKTGLIHSLEAIEFFGERVSHPTFRHIRSLFPKATLIFTCGMSEAQGNFGYRTVAPQENVEGLWYESRTEYFLEILTEAGASAHPEPYTEGELIMTTLAPFTRAFPLIRYKTGDRVLVCASSAPGQFTFTTLGRDGGDRLKMLSGMIWRDEVERVLTRVLGEAFTGEYEFELDDTPSDNSWHERGIIRLPSDLYKTIHVEEVADTVAEELRVGPERSYADGVRLGLYGNLTMDALLPQARPGKRIHLYRTKDSHKKP